MRQRCKPARYLRDRQTQFTVLLLSGPLQQLTHVMPKISIITQDQCAGIAADKITSDYERLRDTLWSRLSGIFDLQSPLRSVS